MFAFILVYIAVKIRVKADLQAKNFGEKGYTLNILCVHQMCLHTQELHDQGSSDIIIVKYMYTS